MTVTITRLYDEYETAIRVVRDLEMAGLTSGDISIVASNAGNWYKPSKITKVKKAKVDRDGDGTDDRVEGAEAGAGIGAVAGGAAGLLAGLGMIAIPGIGPVVAAGWLVATAAGAAAGGAAGGIIGGLTQAGVDDDEADLYAEGVRRGGTLVTARVPDMQRAKYEAIMDRNSVNIKQREAMYKETGWSGFDEAAPSYTAEQARAERSM